MFGSGTTPFLLIKVGFCKSFINFFFSDFLFTITSLFWVIIGDVGLSVIGLLITFFF